MRTAGQRGSAATCRGAGRSTKRTLRVKRVGHDLQTENATEINIDDQNRGVYRVESTLQTQGAVRTPEVRRQVEAHMLYPCTEHMP
jgi:hypothetical protein